MADVSPDHSDSTSDGGGAADTSRMSIGDHIEELRSCMIQALVGVVLCSVVGFVFGKDILGIICKPLFIVQFRNGLQPSAQVLSPSTAFLAYLKIGIFSGLILAGPWVLYQIWRFVAIGLHSNERRFIKALLPGSIFLFATGVTFLYFIVLPVVLNFFITFNKNFELPDLTPSPFQRLLLPDDAVEPPSAVPVELLTLPLLDKNPKEPPPGQAWINTTTRRLVVSTPGGLLSSPMEVGPSASSLQSQFALDFYISFVLMLSLAFGIAFETPIVVYFLAMTGIVSTVAMRKARRYVVLGMVVGAAILTPPDVISQLLLAGPMYLLFEVGLILARIREKKRGVET